MRRACASAHYTPASRRGDGIGLEGIGRRDVSRAGRWTLVLGPPSFGLVGGRGGHPGRVEGVRSQFGVYVETLQVVSCSTGRTRSHSLILQLCSVFAATLCVPYLDPLLRKNIAHRKAHRSCDRSHCSVQESLI